MDIASVAIETAKIIAEKAIESVDKVAETVDKVYEAFEDDIDASISDVDDLYNSFEDDIDIDSPEDGDVQAEGGSYKDVYIQGEGEKYEIHHMPAHDTTELKFQDGPAIRMEKTDHRQTASCGNSREAQEYRAMQKELINEGKFREAIQMDIDDIKEKFGDKYDNAISQMLDYVDKLETEGKI